MTHSDGQGWLLGGTTDHWLAPLSSSCAWDSVQLRWVCDRFTGSCTSFWPVVRPMERGGRDA